MGDFLKYQKLPPGWDCKFDQATGNCYYVNYFTKAMQLEDPRSRYRQLQNERCSIESIPMQPLQGGNSIGGSPYHVYPSNNLTAMRAFHSPSPGLVGNCLAPGPSGGMPPSSLYGMSTSPLLSSSSRGQLEMSPLPFNKSVAMMQTPRMMANMSRRSTIQETSFSTHIDTDAVVAKIQNMFPTAGENHIRLLLKKYYNREAVVISALQVEKHPVTMPGPIATPPAQRHLLFHSNSAFHMTPPARRLDLGAGASSLASRNVSRTASPTPLFGRFGSVMSVGAHSGPSGCAGIGKGFTEGFQYYAPGSPRLGEAQWRQSPKPHSSPKMKLRYMKNIFPKADEMLILDVLSESDNNVQSASEKLLALGYAKRDCLQPPKVSNRYDVTAGDGGPDAVRAAANGEAQKIIPLRPKEYSDAEKAAMHQRLKEKYSRIAERIIVMALESVGYAEDRAMQILQIVQEEEDAKLASAGIMTSSEAHAVKEDTQGLLVEGAALAGDSHNINAAAAAAALTAATTEPIGSDDVQDAVDNANARSPMPSINVTTPTTASTQIIHNENPNVTSASTKATKLALKTSSSSPPSSSSSSSTSSPSNAYEKLTTAGLLARCATNMHDTFSSPTSYAADYLNANASASFSNISSTTTTTTTTTNTASPSSIASLLDTLKISRRSRDKSETLKGPQRHNTECNTDDDKKQTEFQSLIGRINSRGHDTELSKGPDEELLLADYVTWNGANPDITIGHQHQQLAHGPDTAALSIRPFNALGHKAELCKGAQKGLAKGSIYAQIANGRGGKGTNVLKCN